MFIKVNLSTFRDQFKAYGRADQFSYEGLELLFDHLEELEFCDEPYELDVIALCCDFAESLPGIFAMDYGLDVEGMDDEAVANAVREHLEENAVLVGETESGSFVYQQF